MADGDARAAYKTANIDMRQYKRLQMFTHCEQNSLVNQPLKDHDISVFIRIGSDYQDNYYEYEVPLKVTPPADQWGKMSADQMRDTIWPPVNNFNIELELFENLKEQRDKAMTTNPNVTYQTVFTGTDKQIINNKTTINTIRIRGNPSLSNVQTIMIGIRNPGDANNPYKNDGLPKSAEVWVDELRLTDFSDKGGWAANARTQIKLADFGMVNLSGSIVTPGFGGIETKVNDRAKEETMQYDLSGNFELGKFFPKKTQITIPTFASYSQTIIMPEYDPLDPDITMSVATRNMSSHDKDTFLRLTEDRVTRRSINFTNVKINKVSKKPHFYDPGNFSISYSYSDIYATNINTVYNLQKIYKVGFTYLYNVHPKNVMPLKNVKLFNNSMFRIFKDLNFYYLPTSVSFRTYINRTYQEVQLRNLFDNNMIIAPTYEKNFLWTRAYDVKYDLTKALKIDFTANNLSTFYEDPNHTITSRNLLDSLKTFGHTTEYDQQINVTYNTPINKLPLLDWTSLQARYTANYSWQFTPPLISSENESISLGNTIKNGNSIQLNGQLNFSQIYNKVKFLRDLNQTSGTKKGQKKEKKEKEMKTVTFQKHLASLKAGVPKSITHKLGSEEVKVTMKDASGKEIKGKTEVVSSNRILFTSETDATDVTVVIEGKVEAGPDIMMILFRNLTRLAIGVKNISASYTVNGNTLIPGYTNQSNLFGSVIKENHLAPGLPFILGVQDDSIARKLGAYRWLTDSTALLNSPIMMNRTKNWNFRSTIEPLPGLKIDLVANYSNSQTISEYYNWDGKNFDFSSPTVSGNFSMTIISLSTFENLKASNQYQSKAFQNLLNYRSTISSMLHDRQMAIDPGNYYRFMNNDSLYPSHPGNQNGFGPTSQQVLIPSFLAAYTGVSPGKVPLDMIPGLSFLRPNWRITYDGLSNIPFVALYLRSVTLSHSYSSTYNIGSYTTDFQYDPKYHGNSYEIDSSFNFYPQYDVGSVSINEQFSPLIGIDMTWKNNLSTRFEYKKSRILVLELDNDCISETRSDEYIIGAGYKFPNVPLRFITLSGTTTNVKSDLNLKVDLSIKDDITILRSIQLQTNQQQATAGTQSVQISVTADYALSDKLKVSLFYKRLLNNPVVQTTFRTVSTDIGFSVNFALAQ
jgi:cell surface protein SprA